MTFNISLHSYKNIINYTIVIFNIFFIEFKILEGLQIMKKILLFFIVLSKIKYI